MRGDGQQLFEELMSFRPDGLSPNAWAVKAGVSRTVWQDLKRHGNPSRRTLEKLLSAAGSSLAEFEALRVGKASPSPIGDGKWVAESSRGWHGASDAPVPLIATRLAGEWRESGSGIDLHSIGAHRVIGLLDRPAALAADRAAYALTVHGESMWPRFRPGRRLLVSPAAPAEIGDDVLVQLICGEALIKELVGRSASLVELRQFNPNRTFSVEAAEIAAVHKVLGEAI